MGRTPRTAPAAHSSLTGFAGQATRAAGRARSLARPGARVLAACGAAIVLAGCASPDPALWPPAHGAPRQPIVVSLDTWHAMIAFPQPGERRIEEWGYAEQAWYLENRQGVSGALRVLFRATPAVVEVARGERVWAERTPQPPADRFEFELSEEGARRLRRYLEASLAARTPLRATEGSSFYPAARDYNLLAHQCHQYVALGLREAGLPVSAFWAFSRSSFAAQLERAEAMAQERAAPSALPGAAPAR